MAYGSWTAGQKITAQRLQDISGIWQAYTPAWTAATTNPVVNNGTLTGRYARIGDTIHFEIKLTAGSTTTYGSGTYSFSLPVAAAGNADMLGDVFVGDASVGSGGYSSGVAFIGAGGTTVNCYVGATGATSVMSPTVPQTFANGDRIWIAGVYEAA